MAQPAVKIGRRPPILINAGATWCNHDTTWCNHGATWHNLAQLGATMAQLQRNHGATWHNLVQPWRNCGATMAQPDDCLMLSAVKIAERPPIQPGLSWMLAYLDELQCYLQSQQVDA
ncbi:hypothetical protein BDR04DRAFT_1161484 [Suillus decipiens]|nr:hypothetical protein BDR04DRAFT_1161484 [Suillus decipiens]